MHTVILTVLVLGLLVFVHELGHFLTAKWAGIAVPRFSIGLGPRVVGVQVGETDYCLSAVPFGGYVKMAGMEGEEAFEGLEGGPAEADAEADVPPERRFDNKSLSARLIVISAGVLMNFLLGWVIYVALSMGGIGTVLGTTVAEVDSVAVRSFSGLEALAGATIERIDGQPVANWYEIAETIESGTGPVTFELDSGETVAVATPSPNDRERVSAGLVPLLEPVIDQVLDDGPAAAAGIQPGDRIVAIDGEPIPSFFTLSEVVRERPDRVVPVVVERSGADAPLTLTVHTGVQKAPRPEDGRFVDIGWLGVTPASGNIRLGFGAAILNGTTTAARAGTLILGGLVQLVTGDVSLRSLGGPVAIGQLTGHFARQGFESLLGWIALFSINLAILNLLPIPVLDGGHIVFLGLEAMRGRPLSARQKLRLSQVGLPFLVLLMAWAFTADILRLVGF